ncbi:MAG: hypothetical protein KC572_04590 [Gammaproteobacteria bacterium]|nr:hypothetical protein [Gammaproteobacteria bacterium]
MTRDARHLALPQVGAGGQQRIANGRVLLIGVGGIGCAAVDVVLDGCDNFATRFQINEVCVSESRRCPVLWAR